MNSVFKRAFAVVMLSIATAITVFTIGDALAASLKVWSSGETIRAADLNANFSILSGTVNGVTTIARGGTAGTATPTAGAVAYGKATSYGFTAASAADGYCLKGRGDAGVPYWESCAGTYGGVPLTLQDSLDAGVASTLSRSDHAHTHGSRPIGTGVEHAVATSSYAGFMSAADKTKLDHVGTTFSGTVQTTNATPAVVATRTITGRSVETLQIEVAGIRGTTFVEAGGYLLQATFRRGSGTAPVQVGTTTVLATHEDVAGWNAALVLVGDDVQVQVTGVADVTINWIARGRSVLTSI